MGKFLDFEMSFGVVVSPGLNIETWGTRPQPFMSS